MVRRVREHIAAEGGLKAVTHIREMIKDFVDGGRHGDRQTERVNLQYASACE